MESSNKEPEGWLHCPATGCCVAQLSEELIRELADVDAAVSSLGCRYVEQKSPKIKRNALCVLQCLNRAESVCDSALCPVMSVANHGPLIPPLTLPGRKIRQKNCKEGHQSPA